MGSDRFYSEEEPSRLVKVDPFRINQAPVTNREFAAFVNATGYPRSRSASSKIGGRGKCREMLIACDLRDSDQSQA